MNLPPLPEVPPAWLTTEIDKAAQTDLPMGDREIRERKAAGLTHAAVEVYLRDRELRETEGETYEAEEMFREEAILVLAEELGITDERALALWTVAEESLQ